MFGRKKFKKGMIAGIKSMQSRINSINNNLNIQYGRINERLDRFDEVNDLLIDEMKKIKIRNTYGFIDEKEYSQVLSKEVSALLCGFFLNYIEEKCNANQYEFFKSCCVKIENFAIVEDMTNENILLELSEMCDKNQSEIVIKLISLFYCIENYCLAESFIDSEILDEFLISNKKLRDIKKYIETMNEIYGDKLCFMYGYTSDKIYGAYMAEIELIDPNDMYQHGLNLVNERKSDGLGWIIKAAEFKNQEAQSYLMEKYLSNVYLIGYKNQSVYYIPKHKLDTEGKIVVCCMSKRGEVKEIYQNNRVVGRLNFVNEGIIENDTHLAFAIHSKRNDYAYLFSIDGNKKICTEIDSWRVPNMQMPVISNSKGKIFYGNLIFDIKLIRNAETTTDYRICFDGTEKEEIYS